MGTEFTTQWTSPSNIALVKYWGKFGNQMPENPSISFTLKHSVTTLSMSVTKSSVGTIRFLFEGMENPKFQDKISKFLLTQQIRFPWLANYHLEIHSSNTFPHSSGIASSASSMSALCLSLLSVDEFITGKKFETKEFFKNVSELSRIASGSASRSVYPGLASWGESSAIPSSSNLFASQFSEAHDVFKDYCDSILIVDDGEKSVSSRAGHGLMENHPFKDQRFLRAKNNLIKLIAALKSGDLNSFTEIVEEEALTLHALMMTSIPSYILLRPESLWLIEQVKKFRLEKNIPVCFTIDAGPNIHLLYPQSYKATVRSWIEAELSEKLVGIKWIHDEVGPGPVSVVEKC
ncbi:MAG: diphosphomevalonate decarboxylase [Bacteriovorax sp.]|nr:diphosphomevalonate decarboxylase [Bacteriovorax sp.]